ncbi:DNA cytosine methyltransferase [Myceligenerans pegani]|uniref:DNA cytosine methyltransferase n=1 Tax=Myceligenerans pegani TaxID=2776917 RepID=A0ABR9N3K2_9MICO|nr:DNA cytosine methyltransferase [Myceligenerans sp. TRM 65318]MBE1877841.1 DNA cytosine methyltransferase [Myceligenerans sp. TRM 65318]MBE3020112.1 DNA cytosine methyltransferase [Myceligenerans sp. TRM 65318]
MRRPRLLDLYCCQGGAAMGYHRAGFDVVGIDSEPQPRYPFEFVQADALDYASRYAHRFDVVHASPPCHDHSSLRSRAGMQGTGWLLDATLDLLPTLVDTYVVENVMGAPMRADMVLCGGMFGLRVYRHRKFLIAGPTLLALPSHPSHRVRTSTKKRRTDWDAGLNISVTGDIGTSIGGPAMGIDWMTGPGLSQAIPPAYTQFIGTQLAEHLTATTHAGTAAASRGAAA